MSDLHDLTALEQRDALRRRDFSAADLLEHYLGRIDAHGASLGAFVTLTEELARSEAASADRQLADAADATQLPPLLGLPLAFKDLHTVAGVRSTMGSAALVDLPLPAANGHTVGLLRQAGVVTVGTTQAPEFGPTCYTETDVVAQPAVTPYDTTRYASGSSGGAAAAVAAGLLPFGHASDGAGSTRSPAAVCGLVGIKATRGRVSVAPMTSFQSWGCEGPLGRTVADAALMLDVMADPPASDLYAWPRETSFLEAAGRDPDRPLRVLRYTDPGLDVDVDPDVLRSIDDAAGLLTSLGHDVVDGTNPQPWDDALLQAMLVVFGGGLKATVEAVIPPDRRHLVRPYTAWCVQLGETLGASDYVLATGAIARAASTHLAATAAYDVVLTPVSTSPAVPVGWFSEEGIDQEGRRMLAWSAFTPWANLTGQPSLSLPLHTTAQGLPVGVQLTGARRGDDALLISLAGQVERAAPFAHRHPPQW
ncbi:MAG: amidase [Actinobacteria bacterium]|nr:amidase [Actinomycetota bacterium]MCA1722263.1 amidase [Actinomycetota bacterium]